MHEIIVTIRQLHYFLRTSTLVFPEFKGIPILRAKPESIPGISDIMPDEVEHWQFIERIAHDLFPCYGFGEIRTPIFERTEIFARTIGEETDIVQKEMYTFVDRGGRSLTLRPEGTAGVLRALNDVGLTNTEDVKVYYLGPMFRGERPAAGRKRQFHQVGCENIGKKSPIIDAESIALLIHFLSALGINSGQLLINSRGDIDDRPAITNSFINFFSDNSTKLCEDCRRRLTTNVWRILDCKQDDCRQIIGNAPSVINLLRQESRAYFNNVCDYLTLLGIPYLIEPRLVRGLDYYEHTVFEVIYQEGLGTQNAIAGGGRYQLNLPDEKLPLCGVGFAAGIERLLLIRKHLNLIGQNLSNTDVYLISLGDAALTANFLLAEKLRKQNLRVKMDMRGRGMKAQMRQANKSGSRYALIRGDRELENNILICKNLQTSEQYEILTSDLTIQLIDTLRGNFDR